MRQAIVTKFLEPTNKNLCGRVKATAQAGSVTIPWNSERGMIENHRAAANKLAEKLGWEPGLKGGGMPDGVSYCWLGLY